MAFLLLPKPWRLDLFASTQVIELELVKSQLIAEDTPDSMPVAQPPAQPAIDESPVETPNQQPSLIEDSTVEPEPVATPSTEPLSTQPLEILHNSPPEVNAGDVLLMMQNRTSVDIPAEFQARTGAATDFYIPEQEIQDWLADIPFLDESVDKPKLQMKFYADGLDGSIEKFFDKITISKTFTTKYGTKIHCALIGVIAACSWK